MKQVIKLTESELHNIIENTIKKVINEVGDTPKGQKALGALSARQNIKGKQIDHEKEPHKWSDMNTRSFKTQLHAVNKGKGNEYKWGNKNLTDKDHPYNQGYNEYTETNESRLNRVVKNSIKKVLRESEDIYGMSEKSDEELMDMINGKFDDYDEELDGDMENIIDAASNEYARRHHDFAFRHGKMPQNKAYNNITRKDYEKNDLPRGKENYNVYDDDFLRNAYTGKSY